MNGSQNGYQTHDIYLGLSSKWFSYKGCWALIARNGQLCCWLDFIIIATITRKFLWCRQLQLGCRLAYCQGFVTWRLAVWLHLCAISGKDSFHSGRYQRGLVIGSETLSRSLIGPDHDVSAYFSSGAGGGCFSSSRKSSILGWKVKFTWVAWEVRSLTCGGLEVLSSPFSGKQKLMIAGENGRPAIFDFLIRDVAQSIHTIEESQRSLIAFKSANINFR